METVLMIAEIVFYVTISVTVLIVGPLCVILLIHSIQITKELKGLVSTLHSASREASDRVRVIMDLLDRFFAFFFKKRFVRDVEKKKTRV